MLPEDREVFLHFVRSRDPVVIVELISDGPGLKPVEAFDTEHSQSVCLWNQSLLPSLTRKYIARADRGPYYRVDESKLPVLEFTTSFRATWDGKPALGQGRVYGTFEGKPPEFEKWYETIARWLRKNFHRNPTKMGGYVGPAAYAWFEKGGYLLPTFSPPKTAAWLAEIKKQH
jgi:hypothetical protein